MELKIGKIFTTEKGTKLQVKEAASCQGCHFYAQDDCSITLDITGECSRIRRKDNKSVIFKKI